MLSELTEFEKKVIKTCIKKDKYCWNYRELANVLNMGSDETQCRLRGAEIRNYDLFYTCFTHGLEGFTFKQPCNLVFEKTIKSKKKGTIIFIFKSEIEWKKLNKKFRFEVEINDLFVSEFVKNYKTSDEALEEIRRAASNKLYDLMDKFESDNGVKIQKNYNVNDCVISILKPIYKEMIQNYFELKYRN